MSEHHCHLACTVCHPIEEQAGRQEHEPALFDVPNKPTCLRCHGRKHRLPRRTRVWDRWAGGPVREAGS